MSLRTAFSVGVVVAREAKIRKAAIRKDVAGHVRRERHGKGGLLDQRRHDENERAEQARRQIRQPVTEKPSCQKCPRS